jgi:tetratricopeptide (TPR) repeat protein
MLFSDDSNFKKYSLAMHKIYQNKRPEAISILETMINIDNELIADKIRFDCAYLYFSQGDNDRAIELIKAINDNSPFKEQAILFEAEIFDYILKNKSKAAELYLLFLDDFKLSIYYESVRFRLRELAG